MLANEKNKWLQFLSWWVFILPIPAIGLMLTAFMLSGGGDVNDPVYLSFLTGAEQNPMLLRLAGLSIICQWAANAAFFIALSRYYRGEYPINSTFLAACGLGLFIPMSAGNLHWTASMDLANRYGSASAQDQTNIEGLFATVFQIVEGHIDTANLIWAMGMLLFISMALKTKDVPKYILVFYSISAAIFLAVFASNIFGFTFPFVFIPLFWLVTIIGHISLGIHFLKKKKTIHYNQRTVPASN